MSAPARPIDMLALMEACVTAALSGAAEIMQIYATEFDVTLKGDDSPVTAADHRAEAAILTRLKQITPDIPVVAEEEIASGHVPPMLGERFFLVDPLDGTREFISRNGEFTVNIGLIEDGAPVAGVVVAPALGLIWCGIVGQGAWMADLATPFERRVIEAGQVPESGCKVLASRSHAGAATEAMLGQLAVGERIAAGSSLKFCRIAEGAADIYPRLGRTMEWDTAAADAVLRAAGGITRTSDGAPLLYGKRNQGHDEDFANPWFVALGRGAPEAYVKAMAGCLAG